jgi:hypothetical protein
MKLNFLLNLILSYTCAQSTQGLDQSEKPLHIAISMAHGTRSHIKYLMEITQLLTQKGHRITYTTLNEFEKFSKGYNVTFHSVGSITMDIGKTFKLSPFQKKGGGFHKGIQNVDKVIGSVYEHTFPQFEQFYAEDKPDLMICDWSAPSCYDSAAKHSIPLIIGYQTLSVTGVGPYLTITNGLEPTTIEDYTFWQRFDHAIIEPIRKLYETSAINKAVIEGRKKNGVPPKNGLLQWTNLGLGLANSYIGLENPRSMPSHIIPVGPIFSDEHPPLTEELELYLGTHSKVIYVAFGSLIRLKTELSANLLEYFRRLLDEGKADGIIWGGLGDSELKDFPKSYVYNGIEYSTESILNGENSNYKALNWAPQFSILNHPSTKLYMTHAGVDSMYEAVDSATPMIVIPHTGDQPRNSMLIKEHGIGDYIEWPSDGDEVINSKFTKLLNSENGELKSNLKHYQLISKLKSNRKQFAADLVETYARSAQVCRVLNPPKAFEIPCEVKPYLPLDRIINPLKANLIDVYTFAMALLISVFVLASYLIYFVTKKALRVYKKEKAD